MIIPFLILKIDGKLTSIGGFHPPFLIPFFLLGKLIQVFKENGIIGWKRNYPVKGHPDFVFLDKKIAIFVDGCFWHGHDCRNTRPSDNADYWTK